MESDVSTLEAEIPAFPFDRQNMGPPSNYAELREGEALQRVRLWDGKIAWLATRYDDVRALLADNRFSADPRRSGYPSITPARDREKREDLPFFVMMDPPEHTRYRRMLTKEFTIHRIQALQSGVERVVNDLIDALEAHGAPLDMVRHFCLPLPTTIIANMLGVPQTDHEFFQDRTVKLLGIDGAPGVATQAGNDLRDYMVQLTRDKAKNPEAHDDIMGRLVVDQIQPGNLNYDEAAMLAVMLMLAGHETTANMIGLGVLSLLQNPPVFKQLQQDPSPDLLKRAIEEMLRYHSIVHYTGARVALEDVEYGGVTIKAGEGILPQILAANHDPRRFNDPERFDIARENFSPHVAFGFGIHQCLGQPLSRMEMGVVFSNLPRRMPGLRLAVPFEDLPFKRNLLVHGLVALPVRW
jgi:cytochrome P450